MLLLNLGCGKRFHPDWINVDFVAWDDIVVSHDLRQGVPFPDRKFDVVYHSHLLEHFPKADALPFLRECYRVLKPGGIIRIAVPDLERIAKLYLQALEEAAQGNEQWRHHYDWVLLELYDQTVRERPSGEMAAYLHQKMIPNKEFVLERIGLEGQRIFQNAARTRSNTPSETVRRPALARILYHFYRFLRDSAFRRELIIQRVLSNEYELLQLGRFRRGGELHLWMYDRYSLSRILREASFLNPKSVGPAESQIPDWTDYNLDTDPDGKVYRPDSLHMEAVKP